MKIIGITGGVGSGKSAILQFLETEYNACVCQMDETAKLLQKQGTECFRKIVTAFGETVVGPDGELDRKQLGSIVFQDEKKLQILNDIVHPEVLQWVRADIEQKRSEGKKLYIVEAALLPEVGKELCDELWYIYTKESVRRERLKASRHYSDEKITQMIRSQMAEEAFRRVCDVEIDNSGDLESTKKQIRRKIEE